MAGVKGRSGTNKGKDKPWQEALRMAVFSDDENGVRRLRKIAEQCVAAAEAGDMVAIKEIGDRLDGKPAQESTLTVENRDASDWTRERLISLLEQSHAGNGSAGAAPANGRGGGPDIVH